MQKNTQPWDNQKEGLGPKPTETQTEFMLDRFKKRFSIKTLIRLHLLNDTDKWLAETIYLLPTVK